jgi:platelet-activating factor acetylhydrolase
MLSTKPPPEYKNIPVNKALILDPWLEPLPSPGPAPLQSDSSSITDSVTFSLDRTIVNKESVLASDRDDQLPRVLVLNSEVFTLWKDHYSRLQDVISAWEPQGKRIMTLGNQPY